MLPILILTDEFLSPLKFDLQSKNLSHLILILDQGKKEGRSSSLCVHICVYVCAHILPCVQEILVSWFCAQL